MSQGSGFVVDGRFTVTNVNVTEIICCDYATSELFASNSYVQS